MIDIGNAKIQMLSADALTPNKWNPNAVGPENMEKLKASLENNSFFKPVLVRELDDGVLEIIGGEHRVTAAQELGIEVPVLNLGKLDDVMAKKLTLMDNDGYGENDSTLLARVLQDLEAGNVDIISEMTYTEDSLNDLLDLTTKTGDMLDSLDGLDDLDLDTPDTSPKPEPDEEVTTFKSIKVKVDISVSEHIDDLMLEAFERYHIEDSDPAVMRGLLLQRLLEDAEDA